MARRYNAQEVAGIIMDLPDSDDEPQDASDSDVDDVVEVIEEDDEDINENEEDDYPRPEDPPAERRNAPLILVGRDGTEWSTAPPQMRRARRENIVRERGGPSEHVRNIQSPLDMFSAFVTDDMIALIVQYTNITANSILPNLPPWYAERWKAVDQIEMRGFIGLLILCGVLKSSHESLREIWSSDQGRPIFRSTMPLHRFELIMKFLRFDDRERRRNQPARDKLAPCRELLDMFISKCRSNYSPGEYVTVDEQIIGFRGRCPFRVYMKSKPQKYGLKMWALADSDTHYCYNMQMYLGKEGNLPEVGQGKRVVEDLCRPLFQSGRNVTTDNFFTSVELANSLLAERMTLLGTIKCNKRCVPPEMKKNRQREVYSSIFGFTRDITLCSYVPRQGKSVLLLSSLHHTSTLSDRDDRKPEIIISYNQTKGSVDTVDQMSSTYSCSRQTRRWPNKVLYHLIDIGGLNAYILWIMLNPRWNQGKNYRRSLFLKEVGRALVEPQVQRRIQVPQLQLPVRHAMQAAGFNEVPMERRHIPEDQGRGRCHLCERRKQVRCRCANCGLFVCKDHSVQQTKCENCQ